MEEHNTNAVSVPGSEEGLVAWTHVIYALHAVSVLSGMLTPVTIVSAFATGWPSIIAVILNYIKRDDARGTFLESHFRWQIRTFWFTLMWLGIILLFWLTLLGIPIAIIMSFVVGVWVLYRVLRGWLTLQKRKPIVSGG
ncbi:MAG: hypothetical protein NT115_03560 [Proteobacteria bacterium]|nr:hypothetical protein [Pseudomonadota bacterium]